MRSTKGSVSRVVAQSRWPTHDQRGAVRPRDLAAGAEAPRGRAARARGTGRAARTGASPSGLHEVHAPRAGMIPASCPRSSSSWTACRPRAPQSTVISLTHIPTKRSATSRVHPAGEPHRVVQGLAAVGERVADGLAHQPRQAAPSGPGRGRGGPRCRPAGSGRPVSSFHQAPRSSTLCRPWPPYVSWPSWMIRPTSARPARHLVRGCGRTARTTRRRARARRASARGRRW